MFVKRTVFLEFPIYVFDPAKHSDVGRGGGLRAAEEGAGAGRGASGSHDGLVDGER